jgi:hypothetical protein
MKEKAVALIVVFSVMFLSQFSFAENGRKIVLKSDEWTISIYPQSLQVMAEPKGKKQIQISAPQENLGAVENLRQSGSEASWELPEEKLAISFQLDGDTLSVNFLSKVAGSFIWPIIHDEQSIRGYILPLFEGNYVPSDDAKWLTFLVERSPMNTTEGLSMPFWGLDCGDYTLTYILTNQFNNELAFEGQQGRLAARFTHEFTKNWKDKKYGLLIRLGDASPVAPAKQYRQWLIQQGHFVTMQDKIKNVLSVEKLLGAVHIYLWGDALISRYDILDWKNFTAKLKKQGEASPPLSPPYTGGNKGGPGKRIWELMSPEIRKAVAEIAAMDNNPYDYIKNQMANELSNLLARRDFYEESSWRGTNLSREASTLLKRGISMRKFAGADALSILTDSEVLMLNSFLLEAAFPGEFVESYRWGDGVSVKMMEKFAENGFERLWLGLDTWQGGYRHPQAIMKAKELGYLIGPYDSYHSIHHPDEPDTWETAQFDLELYETGAVVRADGTKKPGFQGKGYILSPIAARPYVEKRVTEIMSKNIPFNSWFIDCDAYGELFDDYSELHPATQEDDMNARLARMFWIRDTYKLVIGSERGTGYAVPVIHFAHGMMTPVIGWEDSDLRKDKKSEYYLGGYWPPDGPETFVKQVPLKEKYRHFYFDPRFRLPLYETVFHDSVIATHHWGYASLKFKDQVDTVELLELLYNIPPLYHINLKEFEKHKERMKAHYNFFSPLHRELGLLPMTDFAWLTPDRMVQRTIFGNQVEMVANFGMKDFDYQGKLIPMRSILAKRRDTGETRIFTRKRQESLRRPP